MYFLITTEQYLLSFCTFVLAVFTDVLDGFVARKQDSVSAFGGLLDHTADCAFVVSALYALSTLHIVPSLLSLLVAIAFLQYVVDSGALKKKGLVPSLMGRWNGIAYFVLVAVPVTQEAFGFQLVSDYYIIIAGWALCTLTVFSMIERMTMFFRRSRAN